MVDIVMERDMRLTGVFRGQTNAVEAPPGYETGHPWKVRIESLSTSYHSCISSGRDSYANGWYHRSRNDSSSMRIANFNADVDTALPSPPIPAVQRDITGIRAVMGCDMLQYIKYPPHLLSSAFLLLYLIDSRLYVYIISAFYVSN